MKASNVWPKALFWIKIPAPELKKAPLISGTPFKHRND